MKFLILFLFFISITCGRHLSAKAVGEPEVARLTSLHWSRDIHQLHNDPGYIGGTFAGLDISRGQQYLVAIRYKTVAWYPEVSEAFPKGRYEKQLSVMASGHHSFGNLKFWPNLAGDQLIELEVFLTDSNGSMIGKPVLHKRLKILKLVGYWDEKGTGSGVSWAATDGPHS